MAGLLLQDLGLENLTPEGFAEAEEAEVEPSASTLLEVRDLLSSGEVQFVAVNEQVTSVTLDSLKELAEENGIPVLTFDELLPPGINFQSWMSGIIEKIEALV
jgi:zinc/manganese transport system substrate-binding protein